MSQQPGLVLALKGEIAEADAAFRGIPGVLHAARIGAGGETRVVLESERGVDLREAAFREVVARGWTLLEMTPKQASLEDVFVRLVSREAELAAAEAEVRERATTVEVPKFTEEKP